MPPPDQPPELPKIESLVTLDTDEELFCPPPIIDGFLECGSKMMLVGSSKSHKSWTLLMMAMCLTTPAPMWFRMPVHHCKVLYINFEIQRWFLRERIRAIAEAMNVDPSVNTHLDFWNLRGHSQDENEIVKAFKARLAGKHDYKLAIVDPFYKLSGGGKVENTAEDVASVMRAVDTVTVDLGMAVAYAHHSPKGDVSERSVVDRASGSGVFGRDPDVIVSMMEIKGQPDNYIAEFVLRNHPPKEPLGLTWDFPFMRPNSDVKKPTAGRKKVHEEFKLAELLDSKGKSLSGKEWENLAKERLDMSRATYFKLRKLLVQEGLVQNVGEDHFRKTFLPA